MNYKKMLKSELLEVVLELDKKYKEAVKIAVELDKKQHELLNSCTSTSDELRSVIKRLGLELDESKKENEIWRTKEETKDQKLYDLNILFVMLVHSLKGLGDGSFSEGLTPKQEDILLFSNSCRAKIMSIDC